MHLIIYYVNDATKTMTMKILHTSDWHLGHTLYGFDRTEEQTTMLNQIADIVRENKPDVLLLCGDVYHTSQPSAAVQTMLSDALVKIHEAHPQMAIVMTAGNHDSGSKHEIFRTPWRALNVFAVGQLEKDRLEEHIITIPKKGFVIAVPYANARNVPEGFFQQLLDKVAEMNTEGLPVVMTAHTTVKGCDFAGHDHANELTVGGIDAMELEQMGEGYDYLALGHIHHEQFVHSGKHNVRYCGTPLAISFDENYLHSISMVEIEKHGAKPTVETIGINNPHPLVTLPTAGFASWDENKELLKKYPDDIPAYIRLNVEVDGFLPAEAYMEATQLSKGKQCRFCCINAKRKETGKTEAKSLTVQEFQSEQPIEIAKKFFEDNGFGFDDDLEGIFKEALAMVQEDDRK